MKTLNRLGTIGALASLLALFLDYGYDSVSAPPWLTADNSLGGPDTTVVILNWSRLDNVKKIVSTICSSLLQDTVQKIIIWNNNPNPVSFEHDFNTTSCPRWSLEIVNSPENLYFQARYMACAQASTPYCFIQDDDFLVLPEIIRSLQARIRESPHTSSIHIQPADELLTSELRIIRTSHPEPRMNLHTSFAWLGYGTILHRSRAVEFLALLNALEVTKEERQMADNYFTILGNVIPERWFDAGVPLGGGEAFTVGREGEERNERHILRAAQMLDSISKIEGKTRSSLPYVRTLNSHSSDPGSADTGSAISRAPCHGGHRTCIFETSIALLPQTLYEGGISPLEPRRILDLEKNRRTALGHSWTDAYVRYPPSNAVDRDLGTSFRSPGNAKEGDWIGLNFMATRFVADFSLVVLIDRAAEEVLRHVALEISEDGDTWVRYFSEGACTDYEVEGNSHDLGIRRCVFDSANVGVRSVRLRVLADMGERWDIVDIFVEQLNV